MCGQPGSKGSRTRYNPHRLTKPGYLLVPNSTHLTQAPHASKTPAEDPNEHVPLRTVPTETLTLAVGVGLFIICVHSWRKIGLGAGPPEHPHISSDSKLAQLIQDQASPYDRFRKAMYPGCMYIPTSISGSCRRRKMSPSTSRRHTSLRGTQCIGLSHLVQEPPELVTKVQGQEGRNTEDMAPTACLSDPSPLSQAEHSEGRCFSRDEYVKTGGLMGGSVARIVTPRRLDNVYRFLLKSQ